MFQEAGMKKLDIMQMVASYRRRVQYYQWKLDTLKMKKEDLNTYIRTIEKCVVSRLTIYFFALHYSILTFNASQTI